MKKNKKLITIILIILAVLAVVAITIFALVLPSESTNNNITNETTEKVLGEEDGYYTPRENETEILDEKKCNEVLCVNISSISFLGDNGAIFLNIYPNSNTNKTQDQEGEIKLNFNVGCEDNSFIVSYDFKESKVNEREIQITCDGYLTADHYSISDPNAEEHVRTHTPTEEE